MKSRLTLPTTPSPCLKGTLRQKVARTAPKTDSFWPRTLSLFMKATIGVQRFLCFRTEISLQEASTRARRTRAASKWWDLSGSLKN